MSSCRDPHSEINSLLPPGPPFPPQPYPQQLLLPLGQPGATTATAEDERRLGVVGRGERSCWAAASSLVLCSRLLSSSRHLPPGPPAPEQAHRSLPSASSSIHAAPSQETLFCCPWPLMPSSVCHIPCIFPSAPFAERGAIGSQSQNQAAEWRQPEDTASETVGEDICP